MIEHVVAGLARAGYDPTWREVADTLWLAAYLDPTPLVVDGAAPPPVDDAPPPAPTSPPDRPPPSPAPTDEPPAAADLHAASGDPERGAGVPAIPVRGPAAPALRHTLALSRALRPLVRRRPSERLSVVDEVATADRIAQDGMWVPVLRPAQVRWLDLVLVVDAAPSMTVWRRTVTELRRTLERLGAFRDVRCYTLDSGTATVTVSPVAGRSGLDRRPVETLVDPLGRRLLLVVTDGVATGWWDGRVSAVLRRWARHDPVAVLSLLPQRMWSGTGLRVRPARLHNTEAGAANATWRVRTRSGAVPAGPPIPVLELSPPWMGTFAELVAGGGWSAAGLLGPSPGLPKQPAGTSNGSGDEADADKLVERFRSVASPTGYALARYLSAVPLNQATMRLVQQVMLPRSETVHLAEVFLGGLLRRSTPDGIRLPEDEVEYDFRPGVRERLVDQLSRPALATILVRLSDYMSERFGQPLDFGALLADPEGVELPALTGGGTGSLARVAQTVLRRLGGPYRALADRIAAASTPTPEPPASTTTPADADQAEGGVTVGPWGVRVYRRIGDLTPGRLALALGVTGDDPSISADRIASALSTNRFVLVVGELPTVTGVAMRGLLPAAADRPLVVATGNSLVISDPAFHDFLATLDGPLVWLGHNPQALRRMPKSLFDGQDQDPLYLAVADREFMSPVPSFAVLRDGVSVIDLAWPAAETVPALPDVARSNAVLVSVVPRDYPNHGTLIEVAERAVHGLRDALTDPDLLGLGRDRCWWSYGDPSYEDALSHLEVLREQKDRDMLLVCLSGVWQTEFAIDLLRAALALPAKLRLILFDMVGAPPVSMLRAAVGIREGSSYTRWQSPVVLVTTRADADSPLATELLRVIRAGSSSGHEVLTIEEVLHQIRLPDGLDWSTSDPGLTESGFVRNAAFRRTLPDDVDESVERILRQLDSAPEQDDPVRRAARAVHFAEQRGQADQGQEALVFADEAVRIWRSVADGDPVSNTLWLVDALELSGQLRLRFGDTEAALPCLEEAAALLAALSAPAEQRLTTLVTLSRAYEELGRLNDALAAMAPMDPLITEASLTRRDVPGTTVRMAATVLARRAEVLARLGEHGEAAAVADEAIRLCRRRPRVADPALDAALADILAGYAGWAASQPDVTPHRYRRPPPDPREACDEAVGIYRRLVQQDPDRYGPGLAFVLSQLGNLLKSRGRLQQALAANAEAIALYRQIVGRAEDPTTRTIAQVTDTMLPPRPRAVTSGYHPFAGTGSGRSPGGPDEALRQPEAVLADALVDLATTLTSLGRVAEAAVAADEAIAGLRSLISGGVDDCLPRLANALLGRSVIAAAETNPVTERVVAAAREGVAIYEALAAVSPGVFSEELSRALGLLAALLQRSGQHDEAERIRRRREALGD